MGACRPVLSVEVEVRDSNESWCLTWWIAFLLRAGRLDGRSRDDGDDSRDTRGPRSGARTNVNRG